VVRHLDEDEKVAHVDAAMRRIEKESQAGQRRRAVQNKMGVAVRKIEKERQQQQTQQQQKQRHLKLQRHMSQKQHQTLSQLASEMVWKKPPLGVDARQALQEAKAAATLLQDATQQRLVARQRADAELEASETTRVDRCVVHKGQAYRVQWYGNPSPIGDELRVKVCLYYIVLSCPSPIGDELRVKARLLVCSSASLFASD
jgi:hypothetical protein